jgi:Ser/Thr protein kinase RdoA (MazF antagonist)
MTGEDEPEIPLTGGLTSAGVVRVGNSVRRPQRANADLVRALLHHLEQQQCDFVPRYLGVDARGRDSFSWIDGDALHAQQLFDDTQLSAAAILLRRFHDASRPLTLRMDAEVICHNDPGPFNAIFRDNLPIAWIDFDFAAPGTALEDLAYLAASWCIAPRAAPAEQARQVAHVAQAYGLDATDRTRLTDAILARMTGNIRYWQSILADPSGANISAVIAHSQLAQSRADLDHVQSHYALFEAALLSL